MGGAGHSDTDNASTLKNQQAIQLFFASTHVESNKQVKSQELITVTNSEIIGEPALRWNKPLPRGGH